MLTFLYFTAIVLFMLLCLVTCFVVLIQESKSTGLGASFGGDTSDSLFGTSTADVLKKFTAWLGAIFLISCIILSIWTNAMGKPVSHQFPMEQLEKEIPLSSHT